MAVEPEKIKSKKSGNVFQMPWKEDWEDRTLWHILKMATCDGTPKFPSKEQRRKLFPGRKIDVQRLKNPPSNELQLTWVGHSTFLVQIHGFNILTDPVFCKRASPTQWVGPKRYAPLPIKIEDLLEAITIHAVTISHNHYDHLDTSCIKTIGTKTHYYIPLGMGNWFNSMNLPEQYTELDWWGTTTLTHPSTKATLQITGLPCQHWTMRSSLDRNKELWCAFLYEITPDADSACSVDDVELITTSPKKAQLQDIGEEEGETEDTPTQDINEQEQQPTKVKAEEPKPNPETFKVFHSGDTGYCSVFKSIGHHYGPIDLALIPIGAYAPRWFMKPQHVDPEEAVKMHLDIKARKSVGMHWGTFPLTIEPWFEPAEKTTEECQKQGVPTDDFVAMQHGQISVYTKTCTENDVNISVRNIDADPLKPLLQSK